MENSLIKPLEDIAASYAEIRDRRIELLAEEVELKKNAIKLMHKYGKTIYRRDNVEIVLLSGDEKVKVNVKRLAEVEERPVADDLSEQETAEFEDINGGGDKDADEATF